VLLHYPHQAVHQLDVRCFIRVGIISHPYFQHVIDLLQRVERIFDMPGLRANPQGRDWNRQQLRRGGPRFRGLGSAGRPVRRGICSRHFSVCSLPHGSNFTGGPAPHCGDLSPRVGTDLFKLAAQLTMGRAQVCCLRT